MNPNNLSNNMANMSMRGPPVYGQPRPNIAMRSANVGGQQQYMQIQPQSAKQQQAIPRSAGQSQQLTGPTTAYNIQGSQPRPLGQQPPRPAMRNNMSGNQPRPTSQQPPGPRIRNNMPANQSRPMGQQPGPSGNSLQGYPRPIGQQQPPSGNVQVPRPMGQQQSASGIVQRHPRPVANNTRQGYQPQLGTHPRPRPNSIPGQQPRPVGNGIPSSIQSNSAKPPSAAFNTSPPENGFKAHGPPGPQGYSPQPAYSTPPRGPRPPGPGYRPSQQPYQQQQQQQQPRPPMGPPTGPPMPGGQQPRPTAPGQQQIYQPRSQNVKSQSSGSAPRIDPKQMPRPNRNTEGQNYHTRGSIREGNTIPSSLEHFVCLDDGNATPRYIRSTVGHVPNRSSVMSDSNIPFAAICQPFAVAIQGESPIPVVPKGDTGPTRCSRCRGYQSPFTKFDASTGWWKCHLCGFPNGEGPSNDRYKGHYDAIGGNGEPELLYGSCEYHVTGPYAPRILSPVHVFVIDLSVHALSTGAAVTVLRSAMKALDIMTKITDRYEVGVCCFDSGIYFYDLTNISGNNPVKTLLVTDEFEPFCPLPPSKWLVNVVEKRAELDQLFSMLLDHCKEVNTSTKNTPAAGVVSIGTAALAAACNGLSGKGGKVSYFTAAIAGTGLGALQNREGPTVYDAGDKERTTYMPSSDEKVRLTYKTMGLTCAEMLVTVDVYSLTDSYIDLSTLSLITNETGGTINQFPGLSKRDTIAAGRLMEVLERNITATVALDSVIKVRISNGFRIKQYIGPGHQPEGAEEYYLSCFPSDTAVLFQFEHDGTDITKEPEVYIQCAVLYTTLTGQRRLRVHNLALKLTTSLPDIFRYADIDAVTCYLSRKAARLMEGKNMKDVKEDLTVSTVNVLSSYRKFCAKNPSLQQLILPEALKLLPLYMLALKKSELLRTNKPEYFRGQNGPGLDPIMQKAVRADARAVARSLVLKSSVADWIRYIYPQMAAIEIGGAKYPHASNPLPEVIAPASHCVQPSSVLFLSNGVCHVVYICDGAPAEVLEKLSDGKDIVAANQAGVSICMRTDWPLARSDPTHPKSQLLQFMKAFSSRERVEGSQILESILVIKQNSPLDCVFRRMLVEDKQPDLNNMVAYDDYLVKMHGRIKREMNK